MVKDWPGTLLTKYRHMNNKNARVHLAMDGTERHPQFRSCQRNRPQFAFGINTQIELAHAGEGEDVVRQRHRHSACPLSGLSPPPESPARIAGSFGKFSKRCQAAFPGPGLPARSPHSLLSPAGCLVPVVDTLPSRILPETAPAFAGRTENAESIDAATIETSDHKFSPID